MKEDNKIHISKGFTCYYCGKKRFGAWRWVDGKRSCESCNRKYDYKPPEINVRCPMCGSYVPICNIENQLNG